MGNVLEKITIADYPVIDKIKAICKSEGAVRAMMTGSGPTVFALFNKVVIFKNLYFVDIKNPVVNNIFSEKEGSITCLFVAPITTEIL